MTRQQTTDAAENAALRRYETRRAVAILVAEVEQRVNASLRLDLALRRLDRQAS